MDTNDEAKPPQISRIIRGEGGRFLPGSVGNPGGRPRRHRVISELLDELTPLALERCRELIAEGNVSAIKVVANLGAPNEKSNVAQIDLGPLDSIAACKVALSRIGEAVASGVLTPTEAGPFLAMVDSAHRLVAASDLADRLAALEAARDGESS